MLLAFLSGVSAANASEMAYPLSVAADQQGELFVADRNLPGIWQLSGDQLTQLFQGSKKFRTPLNAVRCVAIDREGQLLAGDSATRDIYRFDAEKRPQPLTDQGQGYGEIGVPMDIVIDSQGDLVVADLELHRIVKVPAAGGAVNELFQIQAPRGLFWDAQQRLWVISGRTLVRVEADGSKKTIVAEGTFEFPHNVVVNAEGTAFVTDGYAKAVWRIVDGGKPEKWVSGEPLQNPVGLELHNARLYVADPHAKSIFEIDASGKVTARAASPAD
jgi:sugar lactone lactonase YvrE